MTNGSVHIWMNLLGFERNDEDRGVERFLKQTGFVPDGVAALMCSPDFFHQHKGMSEEYTLPPDNCAYWGIPRNSERERQPWTNHDLRKLTENLTKAGTKVYASIFGVTLKNAFHEEWIYEHPEIMRHGVAGEENAVGLFALKRFKDGTYYEDFFIDRLCETLTDYGMHGVHLADVFCPAGGGVLSNVDYSTEYIEQFLDHSKIELAPEIAKAMGDDSAEAEVARRDWINLNARIEWIEFNTWRWECFFKKLCARVHAIGKEVIILGMYCTDPFESIYCLGIDLKRVINAGVDYISANILPTSCYIGGKDDRRDFFHKYMALAPTVAAHLPQGHLISMLGVQDATEEWSAMHHAPCRHERDIYAMMAYHVIDKEKTRRALGGYFICLGDGICREDWNWETKRLESAMSVNTERVVSPVMLWSEAAHEKMLHEYVKTRRWTPHKHFYEMALHGVMCGATILPEALESHTGPVLVPNFDMLPKDEQSAVLAYRGGAVLCTAMADFDLDKNGIKASAIIKDNFSAIPLKAFIINHAVSSELLSEVEKLCETDDGTENLGENLLLAPETTYVLTETLTFSKVTAGFVEAMAKLLSHISDSLFEIDKPNIILKQNDGAYRIYLFNDSDVKYHRAFVSSKVEIKDTRTVTPFPILPPRWMEKSTNDLHYTYKDGAKPVQKSFEIKIQPAGVTVIDIYLD